jgi:ABC-type polysaccharide/polyol phosphate export permease
VQRVGEGEVDLGKRGQRVDPADTVAAVIRAASRSAHPSRQGGGQQIVVFRTSTRRFRELVLHLAARELSRTHRFTLLGWAWPLARQLAQWGVLVVLFSSVLHLGIRDYPLFVLAGLVMWSWFFSGIFGATGSLLANRHLLFVAGFPAIVLPVVAVVVPFVDVLIAMPVLAGLLIANGDLSWTIVLLPLLLAIQLVLMCGLAWLAAVTTVFLRDVQNVVLVGLLVLFYATPVFYDVEHVQSGLRTALRANPLTTLMESYRSVLIYGTVPPRGRLAIVAAISVVVAAAGWVVFRRLQGRLVDEL